MLCFPQSIAAVFTLFRKKTPNNRSSTLLPGKPLSHLSSPPLHPDPLDLVLLHLKFLMEISCLLEELHGKMSVASATKTYSKKKKGIQLSWVWGHLVEWKEQVFFLEGYVGV